MPRHPDTQTPTVSNLRRWVADIRAANRRSVRRPYEAHELVPLIGRPIFVASEVSVSVITHVVMDARPEHPSVTIGLATMSRATLAQDAFLIMFDDEGAVTGLAPLNLEAAG